MNPYANFTFNQLFTAISEYQLIENTTISEVIETTWNKTSTERDGISFVRILRKTGRYSESKLYHEKLKVVYPNSAGLKSEALWLKFSSEVCDRSNSNYYSDAKEILDQTSQTSPETKLIYEITALKTISRLVADESFNEAYILTTKLNPFKLSDKGREATDGNYYTSHRQQFYRYKAKSLIGSERLMYYVNWVFEHLNYTSEKREEFVNYVVESCSFTGRDGGAYYSDMVFSNYLYKFDVDLTSSSTHLPTKAIQSNHVLLSELSQYLFCPVSFVLNKNFNIRTDKPMDSSSKWSGSKHGFYDRYLQYQKSKNITTCFEYDSFTFTDSKESVIMKDEALIIFKELFESSIKINNYFDTSPQAFISDDNKVKGAPDYVVELRNGHRVIIAEKFSVSSSAGASKVYNSDIIGLEAYLTKFKNLKIDYAYFINWNWTIHRAESDGKTQSNNMLYVNKVSINKIDLGISRNSLIDSTIEKINILKSGKLLKVNDLSFPNKCLNCSVYSYCEHKAGRINELRFPYNNT